MLSKQLATNAVVSCSLQTSDEEVVVLETGKVLHRQQLHPVFGDWIGAILELSRSLKAMGSDVSCAACMHALCLVTRE